MPRARRDPGPPRRPLAPEDDWFAEPEPPRAAGRDQPPTAEAPAIEGRARRQEPRRTGEPERRRRSGILLAGLAAAVALLVGGVLASRAFTGSDDGGETTTTTSPATAPTTTTQTTTAPPTTTTDTTTTTTDTTTTGTLPEGVVLRPGDESEEVRQLQADLVELGYSTGGVDGKYGPATVEAVRAFQRASGLDDDGAAGPDTLAALSAALDER